MKYQYTYQDYIECIWREIKKRESTYPKMIAKSKDKTGIEDEKLIVKLDVQMVRLRLALMRIKGFGYENDSRGHTADLEFPDLIREFQMRKRYYPRFVLFKRISPEEAAKELAIWREICIYFADIFLGDALIALGAMDTKTRRRKHQSEQQ